MTLEIVSLLCTFENCTKRIKNDRFRFFSKNRQGPPDDLPLHKIQANELLATNDSCFIYIATTIILFIGSGFSE